MANAPNIEVQRLNQILSNRNPLSLQKQNILDPAAKVYFVILSMFQSYKKKHQFQLLQQKVHQIKISETFYSLQEKTKVTPQALCQSNHFNANQILNLIKISSQISESFKGPLITEIVTKIQTLSNVCDIMKCFHRLLCSNYCLNVQICKIFVQQKMILKILSMKLKSQDFGIIAKYLPILPNIPPNLLYFIGLLYSKVQNIEDFDALYKIFEFKVTKDQTKMQKKEIQTLMKINNSQTLQKIQRLLKSKNQQIIKIAENQVKQKLLQMNSKCKQKNQYIMNFIFLVIKCGSNLWNQIYSWQNTCDQDLKKQFFQKLTHVFQGKNNEKTQRKLISNLQIIKDFDHKSQIHNIFFDYFFNQKKNKSLIKKPLIKQYISSKLVCISKKQSYVVKFFSPQFQFVNILLKSFDNDQKIGQFFQLIFNNDKNTLVLAQFLSDLKQNNPVKFKDLFVKIDRVCSRDLFFIGKGMLFNYAKSMQIQIAVNFVRDLSFYPPSKNIIIYIQNYMQSLKNQDDLNVFVSVTARTLNIILIRTPAKQLCQQFKRFLPILAQKIQNYSQKCYKILFGQVTEETNKVLRQSFIGSRTLKL